jgi:hypothetical protein
MIYGFGECKLSVLGLAMHDDGPLNREELFIPRDQCEALVQRIVLSQVFQKATKLQEFLSYICDCYLRHGATHEVKEQQIGVNVYHRQPDYNMSGDSIVRVQARELRKKLALYFETEGKHEPIAIVIPKGGYLPTFVMGNPVASQLAADAPAETVSEADAPPSGEIQAERKSRVILPLQIMLGSVLLFAAGGLTGVMLQSLYKHSATDKSSSDALYDQLLGSIGKNGRDALLVLSNPQLIVYDNRRKPTPAELSTLRMVPVSPSLQHDLQTISKFEPSGDENQPAYLVVTNQEFTGMGEAASAVSIEKLLFRSGRSARLTQARFLTWDAAMQTDLIVLGDPVLSSWTRNNVLTRNFTIIHSGLASGIHNESPMPGELPSYEDVYDSSGKRIVDYGVISMLPTSSGSRILILAGSTSAGTYGTGNFFTDPAKMQTTYERIAALNAGKPFPKSWEILVRVNVRDGIPLDSSLVAVRANASAK